MENGIFNNIICTCIWNNFHLILVHLFWSNYVEVMEVFKLLYSLSYGILMLENIVETHPDSKVFVMYDIACTMKKHLEVSSYFVLFVW